MSFSEIENFSKRLMRAGLVLLVALVVSACNGGIDSVFPKAERPVPPRLIQKMKAKGMPVNAPIMMRIFKTENVLEVWKQKDTGRYAKLETYEICKWSGRLGPKFKEGDRQAPEGFYKVGKAQMNPNSEYHLSFNIGFPNRYDRSHGRTGTHLMVHGACSSAGCYSMNDDQVEEIYSMARDAIKGGQDYFQVQAFPFRMTAENLAKNAGSKHFEFWKMLKEGSDHFELTNYPPKVDFCEKRYVFNRQAVDDASFSSSSQCPAVTMPGSLLASYKTLLEEEKSIFKKAVLREHAKAKRKGTALANVDVATLSIVAKGSEVLPAATPKPVPVAVPVEEPVAAAAPADTPQTPDGDTGVAPPSIAGNAAAETPPTIAAIPTPSPNANSAAVPQPVASDGENAPQDNALQGNALQGNGAIATTAETVETVEPAPTVIPVPQPAQRDDVAAGEPEKKKPWWKRN